MASTMMICVLISCFHSHQKKDTHRQAHTATRWTATVTPESSSPVVGVRS